MSVRVVIVDDHAIVRNGLRQYFSEQVGLRVTGEAANGREALELVRKGDLALLGSNAKFPAAFYSTLAGFAVIVFACSARPAFPNQADPKWAWASMFSSSHAKIVDPLPSPA